MSRVRRASHAGNWYTSNGEELNQLLHNWLSKAQPVKFPARAIIAPHAGYYYCGACAAHAYRQVDPSQVKRVFILGPSHHYRLYACALSSVDRYQTPLYDLPIDHQTYSELEATGHFEKMNKRVDEDEHSLEMHLPYIAKVMQSRRGEFKIVPVLVGSLNTSKEKLFGEIFSKYLGDPENLFVISSDFCHWGERFNYDYYDKTKGEIWQSIECLDKMGMEKIESMNPSDFSDYLKKYGNTICGRHPIGVLLNAIDALKKSGTLNGHKMSLQFTQYAQSSKCHTTKDSSVSYASAALTIG